jgi:hypothetical protein
VAPANKNCRNPPPAASAGAKTRITGPVLDRLIKEKMSRTAACDGVTAMPVARTDDPSRGCNWRVPGYTGDGAHVRKCEAAIREYLEFLATQFDLEEE